MKKLSLLFIAAIILFGGLFIWYKAGSAPVNPNDTSEKIFIIQKGEGTKSIAKNLKSQGLIRDELVFTLTVKRLGIETTIQAGDFRLSPSMGVVALAQLLTHGALDRWITVIEGWRSEEIANVLKEDIETYDPKWVLELRKKEGFLFPDTYLVPKDTDITFILDMFDTNFNQKVTDKMREDLEKQGRTLGEAIILASLVEREAKFAQDRPKVASVILNRLEIGMKLDIDATVQYALGLQPDGKTWWKTRLKNSDLQVDSPFNTYLYAGLPPKPISNPGLASIEAAIHPANTNLLYYLSDREGHTHFSETFEQHQENIQKYLQ